MHSLAMLIYLVYNLKKGLSKYPEGNIEVKDILLTSITQSMDEEALYQASLKVQPLTIISPRRIKRSNSESSITHTTPREDINTSIKKDIEVLQDSEWKGGEFKVRSASAFSLSATAPLDSDPLMMDLPIF